MGSRSGELPARANDLNPIGAQSIIDLLGSVTRSPIVLKSRGICYVREEFEFLYEYFKVKKIINSGVVWHEQQPMAYSGIHTLIGIQWLTWQTCSNSSQFDALLSQNSYLSSCFTR